MKNTFKLLAITAVLMQSCSALLKVKDTTGQTNIKSKFNKDNIIFTTGKTFVYSVTHIAGNDTLEIKNSNGTLINQVILHVMPGRFFNQTKISFQYANETSYVGNKNITGIIENKNEVWIHPPRTNFPFIFTECAPFPQIHFPIEEGKTWTSITFVPKGQYEEINLSGKIENKWEIGRKQKLDLNYKTYQGVWDVKSTGTSTLGTAVNHFYFSPSDGFVKVQYEFPNKEKLIFELIKINKAL
jgi:hypothetical protein